MFLSEEYIKNGLSGVTNVEYISTVKTIFIIHDRRIVKYT